MYANSPRLNEKLMKKIEFNKSLSIISFEEMEVTTGQAITLPQKVTVNMSDGTQNEVDVQWDNENDVDYSTQGEYIITGTVEGTELKPKIKVIVNFECVIVKLEELTGDSVDLSEQVSYEESVEALVEAQEAVDNMEEGQEKNELNNRIEVSRKFIEDTKIGKEKLKEFEDAINNQVLVEYEVYAACYQKYISTDDYLYGDNNLNGVTKKSLKEKLKADYTIYNKDRFKFFQNPVRFDALDTYTSYIEENKSKGNFDLFEDEYKTLSEKYETLKEYLNNPTKEYLEEILQEKKSLVKNMITEDMFILKGELNKVKLIFAEREITDFSEYYEIEIGDIDNYGLCVTFEQETGTVDLNNDKGNDDNLVYTQVIRITDRFWNTADSINVDIKDVQGADTILIGANNAETTDPEEVNILSFEKIQDIQVTTGQAITLPGNVTVNMYDGTQKEVEVQWDNENEIDTLIPGEYLITGTVERTQFKPELKVIISEEIPNMNQIGLLIKLRKWRRNL